MNKSSFFAFVSIGLFGSLTGQPTSAVNPSAGAYATQGIQWLTHYQDAINQSLSTGKPILILFTGSNWCPACRLLEANVLSKPEFAKGLSDKFVFFKAELAKSSYEAMEASPYKPLFDRYAIEKFPTMIVTDANGQTLFTVEYQKGGPDVYVKAFLSQLK